MPSTSGIIQKPSSIKRPRTQRICFTQEPPKVFAYLDEAAALELGEWKNGHPITYQEYIDIVQNTANEQQAQIETLNRWRQQMQKHQNQDEALDGK